MALGAGLFALLWGPGTLLGQELTAQELSALGAGQLVTRPAVMRRGELQLMGGTSYQVVDAKPSAVWQALLDTPNYPRMLPEVQAARVVVRSPAMRKVFVRHGRGLVEVTYYLDLTVDAERREIAFRMDEGRPHGLRAAWGLYTLHAYAGGRTLLVYGIMADIGDGLLKSLVRDSVHEWMLKVPWTIKRFVEGDGRRLYGGPAVPEVGPAPEPAAQQPPAIGPGVERRVTVAARCAPG